MIKLFILPYAGGNSFYFREVKRFLDKKIKVKYVTVPGRKNGKNEIVYHNLSEMAEAVVKEMEKELDDTEYAIFGHSLGSLLAFEAYQVIMQKGIQLPRHIFFSGMMSPSKLSFYNRVRNKMDSAKGTKEIETMSAYEMDMFVTNHYICKSDVKIETDVTILYGKMDNFIRSEKDVKQWSKHVLNECEFVAFDGGHYYFENALQKEELGYLVNRVLSRYLESEQEV